MADTHGRRDENGDSRHRRSDDYNNNGRLSRRAQATEVADNPYGRVLARIALISLPFLLLLIGYLVDKTLAGIDRSIQSVETSNNKVVLEVTKLTVETQAIIVDVAEHKTGAGYINKAMWKSIGEVREGISGLRERMGRVEGNRFRD